ncbi:protein-L-isoaspartate O-methyltransferase [Croceicoccus estronivorus]|uniref:protein-L-isoaspartate O-methyltransferase family protein n=1 Tax=Croceicoccus estronivorus TaxID=1172626 RepID=UPI000830FCCF|nr:protein-L-isoaspartate O-methyltransferase [Croceicoccus estronivorus]OCC23979.1 protein-L-isoaspartate O-methyltransferase [Croceicoccus estronivorus]
MTMVKDRPADGFAAARRAMIDSQLRVSGVNEDFALSAMNAVAREEFVPPGAKAHAYIDRAVSLGEGRYIAAPLFYGRLLAEAAPRADDKILIVDGGSGYLLALIKTLATSIEVIDPTDAVGNTRKRGDFTLLLIDGAIEELPAGLARRLADNGRIVTGLVNRGVTRLATGRKAGGELALLPLAEMGIPVLHEFDKPKGWSF